MDNNSQIFSMALLHIQPSQLYISREKLIALQEKLDFSIASGLPPIPIKILDGVLMMTDGHTRALGTYLEGVRTIPVVWDQDELDWEAYQICMDWCRQEGIHTIADLTYRVVGTVDYQEKWLDRCCKMQADLAKKR